MCEVCKKVRGPLPSAWVTLEGRRKKPAIYSEFQLSAKYEDPTGQSLTCETEQLPEALEMQNVFRSELVDPFV